MDKIIIKQSVRNLVEFVLLKGDIDNRFSTNARAVEGIRAHQKLQSENEKIYDNYQKEVYLSYDFELENSIVKIEGRADGIISEDNSFIIEEIKSTYKKFSYIDDSNEVHFAQAKVYAYIYAKQNNIDKISVRLSYVQLETYEVKSFEKSYTIEELERFTLGIINEYVEFIIFIYDEKRKRNESVKLVEFPFESYREGQKKLAKVGYYTIKEGEILFAQAPTGIGKTISTIFPAVKALGEEIGERIIYITPKTINREVAEDGFNKLRKKGLYIKTITLTAKEKSCCNNKFDCNPDVCMYAKNYYDKIKKVIVEILSKEKHISHDILLDYAKKYIVCPFELSLDLSMYCDGIICDYNYTFDPRTSLTRLIESSGNIVLVDEGHNLVERAREMYSSKINKNQIMICKKLSKGKLGKLHSILNKINSFFIELRNECEDKKVDWFYEKESPNDILKLINLYIKESEEILIKGNTFEGYDEIRELYFDLNRFSSTMQLYDENYVTCVVKDGQDVTISLFCVNPSKNLQTYLNKFKSVILFSATLSPIKYYIDMISGKENVYRLKLPSPFSKENLKVYLSPISTRYRDRKLTLNNVVDKIYNFIKVEEGNYMIFSPSYAYMESLYEEIKNRNFNEFKIIKQNVSMTENEKEEFLQNFRDDKNVIGLCVLGGMFSEGVDLPGAMLIGTVIIGVGYPKLEMRNEIIKEFFNENGYDYAYVYPGINKVLQGAGRVIRTQDDRGRILLIDDRYVSDKYKSLLPIEWYPISKF